MKISVADAMSAALFPLTADSFLRGLDPAKLDIDPLEWRNLRAGHPYREIPRGGEVADDEYPAGF